MIIMISGKRLDGGYGVTGNTIRILFLEQLSPDKREDCIQKLKDENPKAFNQFCKRYSKRLKKLEIEI